MILRMIDAEMNNEPTAPPTVPSAPPTAPPTQPEFGEARIRELLIEFVRDRDVACPRCGYNLRNLPRPVCPECQEPLLLRVGIEKLRLAGLLLTLAPGAFCAIGFGIFLLLCVVFGSPGKLPGEILFALGFMVCSGVFALVLATQQRRFLHQSYAAQAMWAVVVWVVHFAMLAYVISFA